MDTVSWSDRIEQTARVLLWLAIASACVIVPVAYVNEKRAESKVEADLQAAAKQAVAKADQLEKTKEKEEADNKPHRLTLASMGPYMSGINYSSAQGNLWFTNVSPRTGVLCVVGLAADPEVSVKTSESLPACQEVGAYAAVHVSLTFANGDLNGACPKSNCRLTFKEAPESHD